MSELKKRTESAYSGRNMTQRGWLMLLSLYMLALVGLGLACEPAEAIRPGLLRILQSQSVLVSDYIEIGGISAALVNAGLVGMAGLLLAYLKCWRLSSALLWLLSVGLSVHYWG